MPAEQPDKLRLAPRETMEELVQRVEREKRLTHRAQEESLAANTLPCRIGSVPYLNAAPLTRGLEDQLLLLPPSELAVKLRPGELDAALVSVTEVLLTGQYDVLDGVAVASLGEVKSVFLAHRKPIEQAAVIYCDPASLTSICLLRVLLAERGLHPEFLPLPSSVVEIPDHLLLIGDRAIDFLRTEPEHEIHDLGAAWHELTQLPFVYAVWALRQGPENGALRRLLLEARDFGMETLEQIIRDRPEYDYAFRKDYLGWHIHYHLGSEEKRGLQRFSELLDRHGLGPVYPLRFQ
jgi:chorismate dehydratase